MYVVYVIQFAPKHYVGSHILNAIIFIEFRIIFFIKKIISLEINNRFKTPFYTGVHTAIDVLGVRY